ncbi:hypothetical protein [Microlunatus speluncae]|uniref:hypothetical protein n=1 Tax=Microlunatus speluncae TaxID=2594267 RepID=UPI0012667074|nr:hypothetical protein [Microlunatus speluncae]
MEAFFNEFRSVVQAGGRRSGWSPFQFVDAWRTFVREVGEGYADDLYEYWNELFVRDHLEVALGSDALDSWEAWRGLRTQIEAADDEFRGIIGEGPLVRPDEPWWRARLPPRASEDFVEEAERMFKVKLTSVDD